ncbi:MAG: hypothetical protein NT164_00670 [Verrucomicrobiae bacterium]|nr:hypothetical protein [Verrucomicrobiae bacterium]
MKKTIASVAFLIAISTSLFANTEVTSKKVVVPVEEELFRAHEWQVDVAVQGAAGATRGKTGGSIGGNLGVNYFFTKYIGFGLDDAVSGYGWPRSIRTIDHLMADLLCRYPIEAWRVAPYSMVGGGGSWSVASQGYFNIGLGFDYRLTRNMALFSDCRWLYGNNGTTGQGLVSKAYPRIGVRYIF